LLKETTQAFDVVLTYA